MSKGFAAAKGDGALVRPRVFHGANTEPQGLYGDAAVRLKVAASPVDGKASAGVERFLANLVGTAPSDVRVVKGQIARDKTVFVGGVGVERVREVLTPRRR